jgi:hypothetical protein
VPAGVQDELPSTHALHESGLQAPPLELDPLLPEPEVPPLDPPESSPPASSPSDPASKGEATAPLHPQTAAQTAEKTTGHTGVPASLRRVAIARRRILPRSRSGDGRPSSTDSPASAPGLAYPGQIWLAEQVPHG